MNGSPPGARFRRDGFAPNCANFLAVAANAAVDPVPRPTIMPSITWATADSAAACLNCVKVEALGMPALELLCNGARRVSGGGPLSWPSLALELMADAPKAGVHGRV